MSLKDCFEKGWLKRCPPDLALAQKSLKRGTSILEEIPALIKSNFIEVAEQRLYQAFFHLLKALLYKDGIKERSHACTLLYIKEKYGAKLKAFIPTMELLKDLRHQSQYGLEPPPLNSEALANWHQVGKSLATQLRTLITQ